MLSILIITLIQAFYWLLLTVDLFWQTQPLQNDLPYILLRPFSMLAAKAPDVYILFQCLLFVAVIISAICIFVSKRHLLKTKVCAVLNLLAVSALFFLPWEISVVLNFCVGIVLLAFVSLDYKRSN